jgi:glycolate oxidase iron-sulfur subunit
LLSPAKGERRGRIGLVLGCVQRCFDPEVNAATVAVLQANGFEVVIPPDQGCCGAVSHHQGQLEQTEALASALVESFTGEHLDAVLVAASGCGHTMKSYGSLLGDGQHGFAYPVLDVHEFLASRGLSEPFLASLEPLRHHDGSRANHERPVAVAYHDACHMIHGQGISAQPRQLLQAIPHLQLREAVEAGVCCGSAGIYNLVQPDEAAALGTIKANDLTNTGAAVVASANIGCSLQLRRHLSDDGPNVAHPMQLLAASAGLL